MAAYFAREGLEDQDEKLAFLERWVRAIALTTAQDAQAGHGTRDG